MILAIESATPYGSVALVELSTKPLVNLVWIGAMLTLAASTLAALRRAGERTLRGGRQGTRALQGAH